MSAPSSEPPAGGSRMTHCQPPRTARWFLRLLLDRSQTEQIEEGLAELFRVRVERDGPVSAHAWYWRQVFGFALRWSSLRGGRFPTIDVASGWKRTLEAWALDVKFAGRSLRRQPGFATLAVGTLAIGIAANATAFSIIDGALLRPLPIPHAERLMSVFVRSPQDDWQLFPAYANFRQWRAAGLSSADALVAYTSRYAHVVGADRVDDDALVQTVSDEFFAVTAARVAMGRTLSPSDYEADASPVVVLSHEFWQGRMAGDSNVLGRTLRLNGAPHTVVGVLFPGFRFESRTERVFRPLAAAATGEPEADEFVAVFARLREGATPEQLAAELQSLKDQDLEPGRPTEVVLEPVRETLYGWAGSRFAPFMGIVAFVLMLVSANLANLALARSTNRRREMAVRAALGAGGGRLARQVGAEIAIVTLVAAGLGTLLASWGITVLLRLNPLSVAETAPRLDLRVLGFVAVIALFAGLFAALVPAVSAARADFGGALRRSAQQASGRGRQGMMQRALVVFQVACSLLLLTGAGLLTKTIIRMQQYDPGFETRNLLSMYTTIPGDRYADATSRRLLVEQLFDSIRAVPGVLSVAAIGGGGSFFRGLTPTEGGITLEGQSERLPLAAVTERGSYRYISASYFRTLQIPVMRGRPFADSDADRVASQVAIVNEEAANRWWPESAGNVVGRRFKLGPPSSPSPWITVVGVVKTYGTANVQTFSWPVAPRVYLPLAAGGSSDWPNYYIRTAASPLPLVGSLQAAVEEIDPTILVRRPLHLHDDLSEQVAYYSINANIVLAFSAFGLILSAMGIYGVVAFSVARRTHEIGIRKALGAQSRDLFRTVTREATILAIVGIMAGLALSAALTRGLESMLYGISPLDPIVFAVVSLFLALVIALATYLPARRAAQVDPIVALRAE